MQTYSKPVPIRSTSSPSSLLYVPLNGNKFTERVPVINVIGLSKFLEYFFFYGITYLEQKHFFSSVRPMCV